MFSYLEERTPAEVEAIRRTIQELLRQTCILQVKYCLLYTSDAADD